MSNLINKRLKDTVSFAKTFQSIPFAQSFLMNGSLATGKSKETSDIDILTITKKNRLYTARFFMIALGLLTGKKRSKDEYKPHAGKFCFNYFLSADYLKIPTGRGKEMDLYCAGNYKSSVLIWGDKQTFKKFHKANKDLFNKSELISDESFREILAEYFPVSENKFALFQKNILERILSGKLGDWFERKIKDFQIRLIQTDDRTKKYPKLIVCNDFEARFHPPKHERQIKIN